MNLCNNYRNTLSLHGKVGCPTQRLLKGCLTTDIFCHRIWHAHKFRQWIQFYSNTASYELCELGNTSYMNNWGSTSGNTATITHSFWLSASGMCHAPTSNVYVETMRRPPVGDFTYGSTRIKHTQGDLRRGYQLRKQSWTHGVWARLWLYFKTSFTVIDDLLERSKRSFQKGPPWMNTV